MPEPEVTSVTGGVLGQLTIKFKADTKEFDKNTDLLEKKLERVEKATTAVVEKTKEATKESTTFSKIIKIMGVALTGLALVKLARHFGLFSSILGRATLTAGAFYRALLLVIAATVGAMGGILNVVAAILKLIVKISLAVTVLWAGAKAWFSFTAATAAGATTIGAASASFGFFGTLLVAVALRIKKVSLALWAMITDGEKWAAVVASMSARWRAFLMWFQSSVLIQRIRGFLAVFNALIYVMESGVSGALMFSSTFAKIARSLGLVAVATKALEVLLMALGGQAAAVGAAMATASHATLIALAAIGAFTVAVGAAAHALGRKLNRALAQHIQFAIKAEQLQFGLGVAVENFRQLTGDTSVTVEQLTKRVWGLAQATGISVIEMKTAVIQMLDLANITGLTGDQIDALLVRMADFAAVTGSDFNQVILGIDQALRGFPRILQSMGLQVTDETINQTQLATALGKTADEMTKAQKATATFQAVMKQTAAFAGAAAARNVETLAGAFQAAGGAAQNLSAALGQGALIIKRPLLQLFTRLVQVTGLLPPVLFKAIGAIGQLSSNILIAGGMFLKYGVAIAVVTTSIRALNVALAYNLVPGITNVFRIMTNFEGRISSVGILLQQLFLVPIIQATRHTVMFAKAIKIITVDRLIVNLQILGTTLLTLVRGGFAAATAEAMRFRAVNASITAEAMGTSVVMRGLAGALSLLRNPLVLVGIALAFLAPRMGKISTLFSDMRTEAELTRQAWDRNFPEMTRAFQKNADESFRLGEFIVNVVWKNLANSTAVLTDRMIHAFTGWRIAIGQAWEEANKFASAALSAGRAESAAARVRIEALEDQEKEYQRVNQQYKIQAMVLGGLLTPEQAELHSQLVNITADYHQHLRNLRRVAELEKNHAAVVGLMTDAYRKYAQQRDEILKKLHPDEEEEARLSALERARRAEEEGIQELVAAYKAGRLEEYEDQVEIGLISYEEFVALHDKMLDALKKHEDTKQKTVQQARKRMMASEERFYDERVKKMKAAAKATGGTELEQLEATAAGYTKIVDQINKDIERIGEPGEITRVREIDAVLEPLTAYQKEHADDVKRFIDYLDEHHATNFGKIPTSEEVTAAVAQNKITLAIGAKVIEHLTDGEKLEADIARLREERADITFEDTVRLMMLQDKYNENQKALLETLKAIYNEEKRVSELRLKMMGSEEERLEERIRRAKELLESGKFKPGSREELEALNNRLEAEKELQNLIFQARQQRAIAEHRLEDAEMARHEQRQVQIAALYKEGSDARRDAEKAAEIEHQNNMDEIRSRRAVRRAQEDYDYQTILQETYNRRYRELRAEGVAIDEAAARATIYTEREKTRMLIGMAKDRARATKESYDDLLAATAEAADELAELVRRGLLTQEEQHKALTDRLIQIWGGYYSYRARMERELSSIADRVNEERLRRMVAAIEAAKAQAAASGEELTQEQMKQIAINADMTKQQMVQFANDFVETYNKMLTAKEGRELLHAESTMRAFQKLQQAYMDSIKSMAEMAVDYLLSALDILQNAVSNAIYGILTGTMTIQEVLENLKNALIRMLANFIAELIMNALRAWIIGMVLKAMTAPIAAAMAAMWAPAALLAATATMGGAALAGAAAIIEQMTLVSIIGSAMALSAGTMGFGGGGASAAATPAWAGGTGPNIAEEGAYVDKDQMIRVGEGDEPEVILPVSKMQQVVAAITEAVVHGTPVEVPGGVKFIPPVVMRSLAESAQAVTMEQGALHGAFVRSVEAYTQPSYRPTPQQPIMPRLIRALLERPQQAPTTVADPDRGIVQMGELTPPPPPIVNFTNYGDINTGHDLDQLMKRVERSVTEAMKA